MHVRLPNPVPSLSRTEPCLTMITCCAAGIYDWDQLAVNDARLATPPRAWRDETHFAVDTIEEGKDVASGRSHVERLKLELQRYQKMQRTIKLPKLIS